KCSHRPCSLQTAGINFQLGPWDIVPAANVGQRYRSQSRRQHRRCDLPCLHAIMEKFASARHSVALGEGDPEKFSVDVSAIARHDDWLLAKITPFRVTNRLRYPVHFDDETLLVDVLAEDRHAGFDTQ